VNVRFPARVWPAVATGSKRRQPPATPAAGAAGAGAPRPRRVRTRRVRQASAFYLFITPWLLGFLALAVTPIVIGLLMSLTNYDGFNIDTVKWVGLSNYRRAIHDPGAFGALRRTVMFLVVGVPLVVGAQLVIAFLLHQVRRAKGFFRMVFYLPSVVPIVASAWVWKIAGDEDGLFNRLISVVRQDTHVAWLVDHPTAVLMMLVVWAWTGTGMLIFLAALQGIPNELREAAAIDGANRLQIARKIMLPLLTPAIFFQLVMTLFLAFQVLVEPLLLSAGIYGINSTPPEENNFFVVNAFREIFTGQRFGYGAALLWILFGIAFITTLLLFASGRFWVYREQPAPERRRR
jgi:multiple sugar transport system permease protein